VAVKEALRLLGATPRPTPPPSAADAPAADEVRAADCERVLPGGRWPFATWAPYPEAGHRRIEQHGTMKTPMLASKLLTYILCLLICGALPYQFNLVAPLEP
jgi:hypothetical protein